MDTHKKEQPGIFKDTERALMKGEGQNKGAIVRLIFENDPTNV
jgi:hypothetical protein